MRMRLSDMKGTDEDYQEGSMIVFLASRVVLECIRAWTVGIFLIRFEKVLEKKVWRS